MVESTVLKSLEKGNGGPALGVLGTKVDGSHSGLKNGSAAHEAGLQRDKEITVFEPPTPNGFGCVSESDDLRVEGGIALGLFEIVPSANDLPLRIDDHSAHGDFALGSGLLSESQSLIHSINLKFNRPHREILF